MYKHFFTSLLLIGFLTNCFAQDINYNTLDRSLINELETTTDQAFDIYVILADKVDFSQLNESLKSQNATRSLQAQTVMHALHNKAQSSQAGLLADIKKEDGILQESVSSYWIANMVFMNASRSALAKLSKDPRIDFIGIEGELQLVESEDEAPAAVVPDGVEIGLERINVRPMWDLGYTGYGCLALVADTGIDPTHNAYNYRYRGFTNGDNQAWYRWEDQQATPFQCGDHGTHVLGTVLGLDRVNNDTIGVAYDAQWMGSANLCGGGTESNVGTFQWALNPDGDFDTTDDIADVINNSWWDPRVFGEDCNSVYVDVLEALEAAGVAVVFSGGNAGPDPATMTSPHNINVDIVNTFTVAAVNGGSSQLPIADFSSRGPSTCGGEGSLLIKPEVAAPGVSVRSAVLENEYGFKSGTSMAAPHVAGAILVLRQAFPELGSRALKLALYNTCVDLGEPGEDNVFGMGIIDVFAAYNYLIAEGNKPAAPNLSEHDVMAYTLITDRFECNESLTADFVFYNNTPDTLTSVDLIITVDGEVNESFSGTNTVSVAPYALDTFNLAPLSLSVGNHDVTIEIANPNGNVDERRLNNFVSREILVSANEILEVVSIEDQVACEGASMLVKANYNGDGRVQWFDTADSENVIAEGTQVVIPADEATTIYGDILRERQVGKVPDENETIQLVNEIGGGLALDALYPLRIRAIDFYAESTGNFIINVLDGRGNIVDSEILRSDGSGWQTVEVNIRIPEGFGYRLLFQTGSIELGTSQSNIDFPYVIDNIISINDNVGVNGYPFFYNMKVEYLDLCGRVPVEIDFIETDSLPTALFEMDTTLVNLSDEQAINFFSSSLNAESYLWDFGDGNTSEEENPSHVYAEAGIFYVSLTVFNQDGCSDSYVQTVEVFVTTSIFNQAIVENTFEIAPNPFTQRLNFRSEVPTMVDRFDLYSSAGMLVKSFEVNSAISNYSQEMGELSAGLYYVLIHSEKGVDTHKVIKH